MLNIIKSDLYRIAKSKALYISIIVIFLLSIMSIIELAPGRIGLAVRMSQEEIDSEQSIFTKESNSNMKSPEVTQEINNAKTIKEQREILKRNGGQKIDKQIIGQNMNLYYIIIVFVVIVLAKDFSNKSIKNTLSSAVSRRKYYFSKLILIFGLATVLVMGNTCFTYALNIAINGKEFTVGFAELMKVTIYQLPLIYGITSVLVCIAFLTRKTAAFNAISISLVFVCQLLLMIITSVLKMKSNVISYFEIQKALEVITMNPTNSYLVKCALLGIAYIIIANAFGYFVFKKTEIK